MKYELSEIIEKIINHDLFLKLNDVIEINPYHDNEIVYDHSIKTKDIALKVIEGSFITEKNVHQLYKEYIDQDVSGLKRKDCFVLIAFLHDIGKSLSVKENDYTQSILMTRNNGVTSCPGHEYWGSTIVGDLLKDFDFSEELISYIANVIALHDTFNDGYFAGKSDWNITDLVNDVKSRAEGLYIEALFNIYCDNYSVSLSENSRKRIEELFNNSTLYEKRDYLVV